MNAYSQQSIKQCCAAFYGSDLARVLLSDSFHPGGTQLTHRVCQLLQLTPDSKVLDVAAGRGTSAFYVADTFSCEVTGVDLSEENVSAANEEALKRGVAARVRFRLADAERLPFEDHSFDAILCECAFCTFPNKRHAGLEFARVLRPGARLGLSDLTRTADSISELDGLLSWIACIGDAQPVESYVETLRAAGFRIEYTEDHRAALIEMVRQIQGRLLGAEIMVVLKKLDLPNVDFSAAKKFAQVALDAVCNGKLGYGVICATRE
jgi:SAM-dependent methyltransferase